MDAGRPTSKYFQDRDPCTVSKVWCPRPLRTSLLSCVVGVSVAALRNDARLHLLQLACDAGSWHAITRCWQLSWHPTLILFAPAGSWHATFLPVTPCYVCVAAMFQCLQLACDLSMCCARSVFEFDLIDRIRSWTWCRSPFAALVTCRRGSARRAENIYYTRIIILENGRSVKNAHAHHVGTRTNPPRLRQASRTHTHAHTRTRVFSLSFLRVAPPDPQAAGRVAN